MTESARKLRVEGEHHAQLSAGRGAKVEELDEGDEINAKSSAQVAGGNDADMVSGTGMGHLPVHLFVAAIGIYVLR